PTHPSYIYTLSLHDALPISSGAIRRLDALGAGRLVTQEPDQRRPGDEVLRQRGQQEPPVLAHVDLAVDLEDRPVGREQGRLVVRSEEHTSELQSRGHLVCRL